MRNNNLERKNKKKANIEQGLTIFDFRSKKFVYKKVII